MATKLVAFRFRSVSLANGLEADVLARVYVVLDRRMLVPVAVT